MVHINTLITNYFPCPEICNCQLFSSEPYIPDETAQTPRTKCSVCHTTNSAHVTELFKRYVSSKRSGKTCHWYKFS